MNIKIRSLLIAAFFLLMAAPNYAQKGTDGDTVEEPVRKKKKETASERKKREKEEKSLKKRLWYGGGVNIGFTGYNGQSVFQLGVSPMVGYKIWGPISIGPRLSVDYGAYKQAGYKALSLFDFETGIFARTKIWGPIFAHVEGGNQWSQYPDGGYDPATLKPTKKTREIFNKYVGLGYNNGDGGAGYEILVLYNFALANDIQSSRLPIDYRIGFTWKF
jgi:hypothetical protein